MIPEQSGQPEPIERAAEEPTAADTPSDPQVTPTEVAEREKRALERRIGRSPRHIVTK